MKSSLPVLLGCNDSKDHDHHLPVLLQEAPTVHRVREVLGKSYFEKRADGFWDIFSDTPNPQTATDLAAWYNYLPENRNVLVYPLMIFTNHEVKKCMIYSDVMKAWFSVSRNRESEWSHDFSDVIVDAGTKTFRYHSLGSWEVFDQFFSRVPFVGEEGVLGTSLYVLPGESQLRLGTPIEH